MLIDSPNVARVDEVLDERTRAFYLRALDTLDRSGVRYAVGGAYALAHYTGIVRHTKDLDLFVRPQDYQAASAALAAQGWRTELTHPHWLGKAFEDDAFVDLIFRSGNGVCVVDDAWLAHAAEGVAIGRPALLSPVEEIIWSKSFVMERHRFDGADINHLIRARGRHLDWARLIQRFEDGAHERILLAHVVMFGYVYPGERECVPDWVIGALVDRLGRGSAMNVCRGTLLSWEQYLKDINDWGYRDGRLRPDGKLTPEEVERWTEAEK